MNEQAIKKMGQLSYKFLFLITSFVVVVVIKVKYDNRYLGFQKQYRQVPEKFLSPFRLMNMHVKRTYPRRRLCVERLL